jgi:polygalacturonase
VFAGAAGLGCLCAAGQDTRQVSEPVAPPVCIIVKAAIVAPHGIAPQDEMWVDTDRLQSAIDHCHRGQAVELSSDREGTSFLSGSLHLRRGVSLLLDKDVTLYGSRNPRDYDVRRGSCGIVDDKTQKGCHALIVADRASHSGVFGEGTIDGRGGAPLLVGGQEQKITWWGLAEEARVWGHQQVPRLIDTNHTNDFTVAGITLRNSANVHVGFHNGDGLTVWGIKIDTPSNARNADGIDPSSAKDVTIADSYIRSGNDNIAIKAGHGASRNISVIRDHFYWGHGMSIGSETNSGVSAVLVQDLSEDGPDNGIRIKSNSLRGGVVKDVTYEDICIRKSRQPISLDTAYEYPGAKQSKTPLYEDIVLRDVRVAGGGTVKLAGADSNHRIDVRLDGVELTDPVSKYSFEASHADVLQGPGRVNFQLLGEDSTVRGDLGGEAKLPSCEAKFVPFPGDEPVLAQTSAGDTNVASVEPAQSPNPAASAPLAFAAAPAAQVAMIKQPAPALLRPSRQAVSQPRSKAAATCAVGDCTLSHMRRVAQYRRARRRCRRLRNCAGARGHHVVARRRIRHSRRRSTSRQSPMTGVAHVPSTQKATADGG